MTDRYSDSNWYTRSDVDWVYVRINRTGSSWFRSYLVENNFEQGNPRDLKGRHKLVILRDPMDRFLSGMAFHEGVIELFRKNPKRTLADYRTDPHLMPQVDFLKDVNLNNCTFIKYSDTWTENLSEFVNQTNTKMDIPPSEDWHVKVTPLTLPDNPLLCYLDQSTRDRYTLMDMIKSSEIFRVTVAEYLEKDYNLYKNVKWYGTN